MIIEAKDFAGENTGTKGYRFGGGSKEQIIAALENMIGAVKSGAIVVQGVAVTSTVKPDDFLISDITITYAEKLD